MVSFQLPYLQIMINSEMDMYPNKDRISPRDFKLLRFVYFKAVKAEDRGGLQTPKATLVTD